MPCRALHPLCSIRQTVRSARARDAKISRGNFKLRQCPTVASVARMGDPRAIWRLSVSCTYGPDAAPSAEQPQMEAKTRGEDENLRTQIHETAAYPVSPGDHWHRACRCTENGCSQNCQC